MAIQLLCRKVGMTQIYDESGECIPVTVLEAGSNRIVQKKTLENDGYTALQVAVGDRKLSRVSKGLAGHYAKTEVAPHRRLAESRVTEDELAAHEEGGQLTVELFEKGQRVDVTGTSKGRGHAGVVKRHNFAIKKRTHGTHEAFRHAGSIGAGSYPGRVFKGMKMSGQLGNKRVTMLDLEVVKIDSEKGLLFVRGAVPGHNDGYVMVAKSKKGRREAA